MSPVLGILIILTCAASCQSLSCTTCNSTTSESCTGPTRSCPSGYLCGASYTQIKSDYSTNYSVYYEMSCKRKSLCTADGSIATHEGIKVKVAAGCCTTYNCSPTLPSSSSECSYPNGVVCRTCNSGNSTWCNTSDTIQCTGKKNMCRHMQVKTTTGSTSNSSAFRGWGTRSLCDLRTLSATIDGVSTKYSFICSGSLALRHAFYRPDLIGLLLLKFLF
ncbi:uncharacterized protein [Hyperolius riggenbachi]|uniref:uncharacterized protein n=1 Tax=Hyperolius riggenbachi TaxID=752182 RepID=UPI0035A3CF8D